MSNYVAAVQRYRAELGNLTDEELRRLYEDERKKKLAEEDQERFFNQPSADADFDYWSKMAHWTLDEAVALSFGKSPAVVNKKSLSSTANLAIAIRGRIQQDARIGQSSNPMEKVV